MLRVERFHEKHLDSTISLLQRSDSTNRSRNTWLGNNMTAVLAFDDDALVGVIPLERRDVVGRDGALVKAVWVSGAHVDEAYRSQGLGSRMDEGIGGLFTPEMDCVLVCRGDEQSAAYRWYIRNSYDPLVEILSFKKGVAASSPDAGTALLVCETIEDVDRHADRIHACFWRNNGGHCGFVNRDKAFWRNRFQFHYYREFYRYRIAGLQQDGAIVAFAFLGRTTMRDGVPRYDVLDLAVPNDEAIRDRLFAGIIDMAGRNGLSEIRLQICGNDPARRWVEAMGFKQRWESKVMGKPIGDTGTLAKVFDIDRWRYFHVDYA